MNIQKLNTTLFLVLLILLMVACKSKTALLQKPSLKIDHKLSELVRGVQKAQPAFSTVNVSKMSASIELGGRSYSSQASCKMKMDSCIHVSIQPMLGIEMFKLEIDKDSIRAFDKFNKKMYLMSFDNLKQKLNVSVSFNDLQSILSNRFFTVGSSEPNLQACKLAATEKNLAAIDYQAGILQQKTLINASNRIAELQVKSTTSDYAMTVLYADFRQLDKLLFPQQIGLNAKVGRRIVNVDFKISKAVFDTPLNFSSIDRSKFSKGDINQLIKK
ncbi:MAG: DUF4292 domain-containing protein [Paludibacter sp.]|nr:DUF4292 domain-containing protein [Paludibacter sp.]